MLGFGADTEGNKRSSYDQGTFNLVEIVNLNPNNKHVYTKKNIWQGQPGGTVVKFICSASWGLVLAGSDPGHRPSIAHQATWWQHPT